MLNQSKKSIPDAGPDSTSIYLQEAQGTNADAAPQLGTGADWFEQFFTSSSEMLCIIDGNGYFRRVNNALADLLGYSSTELNTQAVTNFVYPRDFASTTALLLQARERNIQGFESRFTCSNGDIKWLSWSTTHLEAGAMLVITGLALTVRRFLAWIAKRDKLATAEALWMKRSKSRSSTL